MPTPRSAPDPSQASGSQPSDDETKLWPALEITAQRTVGRRKEYLVWWEGIDEGTGKPWEPTWEPKENCNEALLESWLLKQKEQKAKRKSNASRRGTSRLSTSSRISGKQKSSTPSTVASERPIRTRAKQLPSVPDPLPSTSKSLKRVHESPESSGDEITQVEELIEFPSPARKKRKIVTEVVNHVRSATPSSQGHSEPHPFDGHDHDPPKRITPPLIKSKSFLGAQNGLLSPGKPSSNIPAHIHKRNPPSSIHSIPQPSHVTPTTYSPLLSPKAKARLAEFDALDLVLDEPRLSGLKQASRSPLSRVPNRLDDSYRTGVVPETQPDASNSQSQPPPPSQSEPSTPPPTSSPKAGLQRKLPSTPKSSTKITRMKPKTPQMAQELPGNALEAGELRLRRVYKRLPVMTPSAFFPHLPRTDSIDSENSDKDSNEDDEDAAGPSMSSIEAFSSPEKRHRRSKKKRLARTRVDSMDDATIFARGQDLADIATRQKRQKFGPKPPVKRPLHEVMRNGKPPSFDVDATLDDEDGDADDPLLVADPQIAYREEEEESTQDIINDIPPSDYPTEALQDASTEVQPTGETAHLTDDEEDADALIPPPRVNQKARIRGSGSSVLTSHAKELRHGPMKLDTDDAILHTVNELREQSNIQHQPLRPSPQLQPTAELAASPRSQSFPPSKTHHLNAALGLLNAKSDEITKLEELLASKDRVSEDLLAAEQAKSAALAKEVEWLQRELATEKIRSSMEPLEDDELVLQRQKEYTALTAERDQLRVALEDSQSDNVSLRAERDALRSERDSWDIERAMLKQKAEASAGKAAGLTALREAWDAERGSLLDLLSDATTRSDTAKQRLEELKAESDTWITERGKLLAEVESATKAKVAAESDVNFFREQYAQASSFVAATRAENAELQQQVKIADGRASEGVASIRAMFQARIEAAEREAKRSHHLVQLLTEKDIRTNDDIRRRAAEEPQLRKQCKELQEDLISAAEARRRLEHTVEELEAARDEWEVQRDQLLAELGEVKVRMLTLQLASPRSLNGLDTTQTQTSSAEPSSSCNSSVFRKHGESSRHRESSEESESREDDEKVYRCRWVNDGDNEPHPCLSYFPSRDALEEHMSDAHHLVRIADVSI
ncbi:hypothetical protein HGRIS_014250 [Hohenbuehelia grisea]|uniref:Chromo domain-containing protein n=1 Tax=Hohenbuehelia grisea TaxID=104357 RepID=A0ABR3JSW7_9AGAR